MRRQAADLEEVLGVATEPRLRDRLVACPQDVVRGQLHDAWCVACRNVFLRAHHLLLALELRVERVAQPVAEEGEPDERESDGDGREDDEMRLGADELLALGDQAAPRRAWR